MKDQVCAVFGEHAGHGVLIDDVHRLDGAARRDAIAIEPGLGDEAANRRDDSRALVEEPLRQPASDEPLGTGDDDGGVREAPLHHRRAQGYFNNQATQPRSELSRPAAIRSRM